jgi:hypothetical protein
MNTYEIVFTIDAKSPEEANEKLSTNGSNWSDWSEIREISTDIYSANENRRLKMNLETDYQLKNGRVYNNAGDFAVLVSSGYGGAGWSSWGADVFCPVAVAMLLDETRTYFEHDYEEAHKKYYDKEAYCALGFDNLRIVWVSPGTQFRVEEYNGAESIEFNRNDYWLT